MSIKSSVLLNTILKKIESQKLPVRDFVNLLKQRSFAIIILVFALAQTVLIVQPPGFSAITGFPIVILSLQLSLGRKTIWLPEFILKKEMPEKLIKKVIQWTLPIVKAFEKIAKPRFLFMFSPIGKRFIGIFMFVLALILTLPIPGGNFLPGLCIALFAFSILQSDGILAILSMIASLISIYFMYSIILATIHIIINWLQ